MHRISLLFILTFLAISFQTMTYSQEQDTRIYIDNKEVIFDTKPVFENNHILVPVREISKPLGASVAWNQETLSAEVSKGDMLIFTVNRSKMFKNGVPRTIDVDSRLINNQLFVPLKALVEGLNLELERNTVSNSILIKTTSLNIMPVYKMPQGADPYYVLFEWLFQHSCEMNFGLKYIDIDVTESPIMKNTDYVRLMSAFCDENGFTLLVDTHDGLLKKGFIINSVEYPDNEYFKNGIIIKFQDESRTESKIIVSVNKWKSANEAFGGTITLEKTDNIWTVSNINKAWIN